MMLPRGHPDRAGVSVSTASRWWAASICVASWKTAPTITIASESIDPSTGMRRSLARFSEPEASDHTPSLADFITTTPELEFSVYPPSPSATIARLIGRASDGGSEGMASRDLSDVEHQKETE